MEIKVDTIKEAWPKILYRILTFGDIVDIKIDGKVTPTMELNEPLTVIIKNPELDMITGGGIWGNKEALEIYSNNVINNEETGHDYTYGERLRKFRDFEYYKECNNGRYIWYDQIYNIVDKLARDRTSRQAIACTWKVEDDINGEHPPCLLVLDNIIRKNKLLSTSYIRSNDMYGAWPENIYMLVRLNQYIVEEVNRRAKIYIDSEKLYRSIELGRLITISNKAHIYWWDIEQSCKIARLDNSMDILQSMGINTRTDKGIA